MNANELRIGNYYDQFGNIHQANGHIISELEKAPEGQLWCRPIPLTEEILLKFGFEKHFDFLQITIKEGYWLSYSSYSGLVLHKIYMGAVFSLNHIQYLHELQNAFFALTNTELNINF